jgi:hypothetical protein
MQSHDISDVITIYAYAHPIAEDDDYNGLLMNSKDMDANIDQKILQAAYVADNHGNKIGRAAGAYKDYNNRLVVALELNAKEHPEIARKLETGEYSGVSLGLKHMVNPETLEVMDKTILEVSVCPEGDLPGTRIFHLKRDDKNEIVDDHRKLDERLERDKRPIYVHTLASKENGGFSQPFTLDMFKLEPVTKDRVKKPSSTFLPLSSGKETESGTYFLSCTRIYF